MDEKAWQKKISNRVREIRRQIGLSQLQFALRANLSYHTIGKIERQEVFPNLDTLIRLSEAHRVPLAEFVSEPERASNRKERAIRDLTAILRRQDERRVDLAAGLLRYLFAKL